MSGRLALLAALALLAPLAARAQPQPVDPDWPCAQALVPVLEPGAYWDGPVPQHTAWRDDETLFALVPDIVNRDTPDREALAKLNDYVATISPADRAQKLPLLFSAIVDETNDERTPLISRIEQLGRRQRLMGNVVGNISTKADQDPASDPNHGAITGERDFDIRAFQETQATMRYACEAPVAMERRLGMFARDLQKKLHEK